MRQVTKSEEAKQRAEQEARKQRAVAAAQAEEAAAAAHAAAAAEQAAAALEQEPAAVQHAQLAAAGAEPACGQAPSSFSLQPPGPSPAPRPLHNISNTIAAQPSAEERLEAATIKLRQSEARRMDRMKLHATAMRKDKLETEHWESTLTLILEAKLRLAGATLLVQRQPLRQRGRAPISFQVDVSIDTAIEQTKVEPAER